MKNNQRRNNLKRFISFLLAFVLVFAIVTPMKDVFAAEESVVQILHLNDVHGRVEEGERDSEIGYAKLKTRIDELRDENQNTLLLNAGDTFHGTTTVNLSQGEAMVDLMNLMGFDAMVPGNHDFNFGYERLLELKELAEFPLLAANIIKEADNTTEFDSYEIFLMDDGTKVGVFGIATDETKFKSHPDNTIGIEFPDAVAASKKAVKELQDEDVDLIISLSHLGLDTESNYTSTMLANEVDGIDVIIDGHSHTKLPEGKLVNGVLIAQAESQTKNLGIVEIKIEGGKVVTKEARLEQYAELKDLEGNKEILEAIKIIKEENGPQLEKIVGTSKVDLDGERGNVRTRETNLGNLITDAMRIVTSADIAITNGGGIRASIDKGDITFGDVVESFPFTNFLSVIEVTGAEIKEALEHGVDAYPEEAGHFAHVSGIKYIFDPAQPVGERIVKITIDDGKALDMNKNYEMVTNDFMAIGGDNYDMFIGKKIIAEGALLSDALLEYITAEGEIDIGLEDRIVIGEKEEEEVENIIRLGGANRVGTSVLASQEAYDKSDTVVIAGYSGEVDALAGTLLANDKKAPLLLTGSKGLTKEVKDEIKRLDAKKVYILGGKKAVHTSVDKDLKDLDVKRLGGKNRNDTAAMVAKEVKGKVAKKVFLASGVEKNLADALTIAPVSAIYDVPVLLTETDRVSKTTKDAMTALGVEEVVIVGGKVAVSKEVEQDLKSMKIRVERVAGDRREDTALEIAGKYFDNPETAVVAYGWKYSDALVGGYLGAMHNAPILLTNKNLIGNDTETYLNRNINKAYVLGGSKVVSESVFNKIKNVLK